MRLSQLLAGLPLTQVPDRDPEVSGITHDSRRIRPGDLFVAITGAHHDGRRFVPQAARRGAVAVLGPAPADDAEPTALPWVVSSDPRPLIGPIAARVYDHPDREMLLVGITGTNGKSTVAALVCSMLEAVGRQTGLVGTLGYQFRGKSYVGERTTPEAPDLFRMLRSMRSAGADAVVMEVSSHALALGRVAGARFDLGVFNNLSQDHLDLHGSLERYFQAKRRLFEQLKDQGRAVLSLDDSYGRRLSEELSEAVTFGEQGQVRLKSASLDLQGIRGQFSLADEELSFDSPLLGRYNLNNLLAAAAAGVALGLPKTAIADGIERQQPLPGRLQRVMIGQPFTALVDYAHTPGALEAALGSLREITEGRLLVVFGCGGDRDSDKRVPMGRIAGELSDVAIATTDNPRSEDPLDILKAVEEGLQQSGRAYAMVPDRRDAIRRAVALAGPKDTVLVAGKGHETRQLLADRSVPFDDRLELENAIGALTEARDG